MRLSSIAHLYRVRLKVRLVLVQELLAVLGLADRRGAAVRLPGREREPQRLGAAAGERDRRQHAVPAAVARSARLRRKTAGTGAAAARASGPRCRCWSERAERDRADGAAGRRTDRRRPALRERSRQPAAAAFPLRAARPPACARAACTGCRRRSGRSRCSRSSCRSARASCRRCSPPPRWSADDRRAREQPGRGRAAGIRAEADRYAGARSRASSSRRARDRASRCGRACVRLAAGRLNVEPADFEATLFGSRRGAGQPVDADLFAAISALVGFHVRLQRDAAHAPAAPEGLIAGLRRNGATRLETVEGAAVRRARARRRWRALRRTGAGRGALDHRFPSRCRLSVVCIPGRLAAGRDLAERRDRRRARALAAACVGVLIPLREIFSRPSRRDRRAPAAAASAAVDDRAVCRGWSWPASRRYDGRSCSRRPSRRSSAA